MILFGSFSQTILVTLSCALSCSGVAIKKRPDKVVHFDFDVTRNEEPINIDKRDFFSSSLRNEKTYYGIEIELGSSKAKSNLLFDTGSSDLWVVDKKADCVDVKCKQHGTYSLQDSTTGKNLHQAFSIHYADDTSANGTFVKDTVNIGNISVKNQQFAVADSSSSEFGVLGIGFTQLEQTKDNSTYDNLPITLKKQGYINKVAYSLYLNKPSSKTGSILFGGVDHAKYYDRLIDVPVVSNDSLEVGFESITINGHTEYNSTSPLLDVGLTWSYLPENIIKAISDQIDGKYVESLDAYIANCHQPGNITFNFANNAKVEAPISSFLVPITTFVNSKRSLNRHCVLGILNDYGYPGLGDNFLRNAYVKYDLEDRKIGLATVKYTDEISIEAL